MMLGAFVGAALLVWAAGGAFGRFLTSVGLTRMNYQGKAIPTGYGVLLLLFVVPIYLLALSDTEAAGLTIWYLFAAVAFGLLGLADDVWGDRSIGGFRGHFRKLFREGKLTTGAAKALLGAVVAFELSFSMFPDRLLNGIVTGLLIALTANTLNLVDTRPVRSVALFLLGSGTLALYMRFSGSLEPTAYWVLPGAALGYLPVERSRRGMLGDAGSNLLGGVLGLSLGLALSFSFQLVGVVLLVGFHLFTERRSLNAWIRERPALNRLDLWLQGPVREETEGAGKP